MIVFAQLFLGLGFIASLVAVGAFFWGRSLGKDGEGVANVGYLATFAAMGAYTVSVFVMVAAFYRLDFSFLYVAENHSTDASSLAWLYQLSGLWAGREGSLLFWAWLLAIFAAYVSYRRMEIDDDLSRVGIAITNIVLALFGAAMLFSQPNNPFKATPPELIGANGELLGTLANSAMNPLLQHWAMILHPPTLFIGYAGLTIPFAFALAAIIVNDGSKKWVEIVDRITVFSWLFLGAGIGLGSVWAYVVLGWGGYWAWDPVENASLLPWLTGVGLIHSFTVYRRRDGFKKWAIVNAAATFALVILGTFITRSGIVQSVHAFQQDPVSMYLFGFMIVAPIVAVVVGMFMRGSTFDGNDDFESLTSKEAAYYFNNLLMLVAAILVAYMTVSSALPTWLPFGGQSIGITAYDYLARPIGILYALILAVCPLLSWRQTPAHVFWSRFKWPAVVGSAIFALLMAEWALSLRPIYDAMVAAGGEGARKFLAWGPAGLYHGVGIVGLFAGAFLIATTLFLFIEGARKRSAAKGESFFAALGNIMLKARTQSGGYLSHIGIGLIIIGLVGSSMFVLDVRAMVDDKPGSTFTVDDYTFTYQGLEENELANGDMDARAVFAVTRDGRDVGTIRPGLLQFAKQQQTKLNADVKSEPLRDIFVVFEGLQGEQLSMNVKINPLIWFAWGGFAVLMIGSALAAWPKSQPQLEAVSAKSGSKSKTR